jgi:hypothetical protein
MRWNYQFLRREHGNRLRRKEVTIEGLTCPIIYKNNGKWNSIIKHWKIFQKEESDVSSPKSRFHYVTNFFHTMLIA